MQTNDALLWQTVAAWAQFGAGLLTFGAALLAVKAAYDAPRKAAEWAEALRAQVSAVETQRKLKLDILTTLMRHRRKTLFLDVAETLNTIDVVFADSPHVRAAWRHLYISLVETDLTGQIRRERYSRLIESILHDLGLKTLGPGDIEIAYSPGIVGTQTEILLAEVAEEWSKHYNRDGSKKNPHVGPFGAPEAPDPLSSGPSPIEAPEASGNGSPARGD